MMTTTTMTMTTAPAGTEITPAEPPDQTTTVVIGVVAGGSLAFLVAAIAGGLYLLYRGRQNPAVQLPQLSPEPKPTIEDGRPVEAARPRTWDWQSNVQKDSAQIVGHKPGSIDNLSKDMYCSSTSCYPLGYRYHNGAFTPQWGKDGGYGSRPGSAIGNFGYH